jgi:hypothetical protein
MEQAGTGSRDPTDTDPESLRLSGSGRRVLSRAISEAKRLNQDAVGGVHLLLGALPPRRSALSSFLGHFHRAASANAAAMALSAGGLRFEWLRADLARITAELPLDAW